VITRPGERIKSLGEKTRRGKASLTGAAATTLQKKRKLRRDRKLVQRRRRGEGRFFLSLGRLILKKRGKTKNLTTASYY